MKEHTLPSECHLVEIDLFRRGRHVISAPQPNAEAFQPYDYLICVNRWPKRNRFELYPYRLRERILPYGVPLVEPDPDVPLDLQAALEQVYENGSYMLRVRYDEPCVPLLNADDQQWAQQCWTAYKAARPDLFPDSKG